MPPPGGAGRAPWMRAPKIILKWTTRRWGLSALLNWARKVFAKSIKRSTAKKPSASPSCWSISNSRGRLLGRKAHLTTWNKGNVGSDGSGRQLLRMKERQQFLLGGAPAPAQSLQI